MLSPEPQLEMKQFGTPAQPETLCDDVQLPGKVLGRAAGTVTPFLGLRGTLLTFQSNLCFLACTSGASFLLLAREHVVQFDVCAVGFARFGEAHAMWGKNPVF